jgi:hypothetical protein
MSHIQTEFGGVNPISLSEYYGKGSAPASGTIAMSQFRGVSASVLVTSGTMVVGANGTTAYGLNMNSPPLYGSWTLGAGTGLWELNHYPGRSPHSNMLVIGKAGALVKFTQVANINVTVGGITVVFVTQDNSAYASHVASEADVFNLNGRVGQSLAVTVTSATNIVVPN